MGAFDDLIPGADAGKGAFDDITPKRNPKIGQPEDLTFGEKLLENVTLPKWMDKLIGTARGVVQGAADPVVGAVQLAANVLPDATGVPQAVNKRIAEQNADYEAKRAAGGRDGFDAARIVGNVASPANLVIASKVAPVAGALARAGQGAAVGAAGGAMAPVEDTEDGFWGKKAGQVAIAAGTGAALAPAIGAIGERVVRALKIGRNVNARPSVKEIDDSITQSLHDAGQSINDIPADQLQALRLQVAGAFDDGKTLDAAAALRKADFDALGMKPTTGQVTRDPMTFAREQNLRGVEGAGEPLSARFQEQGRQLTERVSAPAAGAKDAFNAGTQISESLAKTDDTLRRHVSGLYREARESAGRELDVPLQGLAQDYADILGRYSQNVRNSLPLDAFERLGLGGGTQRKTFNFEDADQLLKVVNANRSNDPAVQSALGELRGAIRRAVEGADAGGGPFAPAVRAAAERFKLHDAVPALKAAAEGTTAPDDFVRRFVVGGKTNDVRGLAKVLQQADPDAYQQARAQIAEQLRRAAFGENVVGDAPFVPTRYMAEIRRLGVDKLGAFFSPQEVADILRVGRVGAAIKQAPNASAVNTSNTAGAVMNLASKVPVLGPVAGGLNMLANAVKNYSSVRASMAGDVPLGAAPLTAEQVNVLQRLMALGAMSAAAPGRLVVE